MIQYTFFNPKLEVFDKVPDNGIQVDKCGSFFSIPDNFEKIKVQPLLLKNPYYHCDQCNGYIAGLPHQEGENTIGILSGRCGASYRCVRCGYELYFSGYVS